MFWHLETLVLLLAHTKGSSLKSWAHPHMRIGPLIIGHLYKLFDLSFVQSCMYQYLCFYKRPCRPVKLLTNTAKCLTSFCRSIHISSQRVREDVSSTTKPHQTGDRGLEQWQVRWEEFQGQVPWQINEVHPALKKYLPLLTVGKPSISILVSWCGKSLDLPWLCEQGHEVVGTEISELGTRQLFEENNIAYDVCSTNTDKFFKVFSARDMSLKVYVGDMYYLTPEIAGKFDAIWDHLAFVAVNPTDRARYIKILHSLLKPDGKILLTHLEYDPQEHCGPPFSVPPSLVKEMFDKMFNVELMSHKDSDVSIFEASGFSLSWAKRGVNLLTPR